MDKKTTSGRDQSFVSGIGNTVDYVKGMMTERPRTAAGRSVEMGIKSIIASTALKRLPVPLNFVVPLVVEKVILKYGVDEGREVLLKGLKWVKKVTDEEPAETGAPLKV